MIKWLYLLFCYLGLHRYEKIDIKYLQSSKIIKKKYEKIKILGQGEIKNKLNLEVHFLSNSAKEKLSKNGSTIKILESK